MIQTSIPGNNPSLLTQANTPSQASLQAMKALFSLRLQNQNCDENMAGTCSD